MQDMEEIPEEITIEGVKVCNHVDMFKWVDRLLRTKNAYCNGCGRFTVKDDNDNDI